MNEEVKPAELETTLSSLLPGPVAADPAPEAAKPAAMGGKKSDHIPTAIGEEEVVHLDKIVFENIYSRNSHSVVLVQIRLNEYGFFSTGDDQKGWISEGTRLALKEFQALKKIDAEDFCGEETIKALFDGTHIKVLA